MAPELARRGAEPHLGTCKQTEPRVRAVKAPAVRRAIKAGGAEFRQWQLQSLEHILETQLRVGTKSPEDAEK